MLTLSDLTGMFWDIDWIEKEIVRVQAEPPTPRQLGDLLDLRFMLVDAKRALQRAVVLAAVRERAGL